MSLSIKKESIENVLNNRDHHAYCFVTENPKKEAETIREVIKKTWKVSFDGNPDFLHYSKSSFEIKDALFLRDWASVNSVKENQKIFILESYMITIESQNALLKIFENNPPNTNFIIVIPSQKILLPTLISRFFISILNSDADCDISISEFLSSNIPDRNNMLKEIIEESDRSRSQIFLDSLEKEIYEYKSKEGLGITSDPKVKDFIHYLPLIKKMNNDQRASVKSVLEHVIYFAPFIKKHS